MSLESNIAGFIKKRGVNLSAMARDTGIAYMSLYDSLFNDRRKRPLKASEFLVICEFLGASPADFVEKKEPIKIVPSAGTLRTIKATEEHMQEFHSRMFSLYKCSHSLQDL